MEMRIGWDLALASLLLSFVLSMAVAWTYTISYQGLSYARTFTQTLAIGGVVSALVMLAIGDDVARGIGLVGALTVIRLRSTLKDTRDLMFVFASLAAGVAAGVQAFSVAVTGTGMFCVVMLWLSWSTFGSRRRFDAVLRVRFAPDPEREKEVAAVLRRHCRETSLLSVRDTGTNAEERSYHVRLGRPDARVRLLDEMGRLAGLGGVTLLMQDSALEV